MSLIHAPIAAITRTCADVVTIQLWTAGNAVYGALCDVRGARIEGTTVCVDASKELTVFDFLKKHSEDIARDMAEQERLQTILDAQRAAIDYNQHNVSEGI